MSDREGVIKYQLAHVSGPAGDWPGLAGLEAWRRTLVDLGLLGRDPARYGGLAYGNVSLRLPRGGFIISGSQTGDHPELGPSGYAEVLDWDINANRLCSRGPCRPSSEALTHAALYAADPAIGCVLHVHSPTLWNAAATLGMPVTDPAIAYGTPAMALEVARRLGRADGLLAMGGHRDGILAYGPDPAHAGRRLRLAQRQADALGAAH